MKTTLYFTDAKSDKVYSAWLVPCGGLFNVAYEYGKRGAHLSTGIKTPEALPRDAAQKVLDRLIAEKRGKGYTESPDGKPFNGDAGRLAEVLPHTVKQIISRGEMAAIVAGGNHHVTRKYDGELCKVTVGGATILTEFMRTEISGHFYTASDRAMFKQFPQGWHAALAVMEWRGQNVLDCPMRDHVRTLQEILGFTYPPPRIIIAETVTDIEGVFNSGGEGVCAHDWTAAWGQMACVKQSQIYLCRVTKTGGTQSVGIERIIGAENLSVEECRQYIALMYNSGCWKTQDAGNVKLGGGACDQVIAGQSFVRIEGRGLTEKGCIREPTKCREWLVKY